MFIKIAERDEQSLLMRKKKLGLNLMEDQREIIIPLINIKLRL
jgi:hypothetical protein